MKTTLLEALLSAFNTYPVSSEFKNSSEKEVKLHKFFDLKTTLLKKSPSGYKILVGSIDQTDTAVTKDIIKPLAQFIKEAEELKKNSLTVTSKD
mmetsp:Transcript_8859/g.13648  ORF Transcript_8859/g.13648 Transcript_8859/m.13648 type:complete len:94 (+) Transcript_8859:954-1235(+)